MRGVWVGVLVGGCVSICHSCDHKIFLITTDNIKSCVCAWWGVRGVWVGGCVSIRHSCDHKSFVITTDNIKS